jgi:hypothetical protein
VPAHLRKPPSVYADRGTALHIAMARLLDDDRPSVESLIGQIFHCYEITADDVENALRPTLAYVDPLLDMPGAEFYVERRVIFPGVDGAFGTCDLLIRIGNTIYLIDYKFGAGVRVLALYPDGDGDVLNAQGMFYIAGARHSLPNFFAGVEHINLMIIQPQSAEVDVEMVSSAKVTAAKLDAFIAAYRAACAEAQSDAPRLRRGSWCRFCPAKPICPEHARPLLDLAAFMMPAAGAVSKSAYLQLLADGLALVDAVKDLRKELHDQAKRALENGDVVPGYTLTAGRAERHWRDDEPTAIAALERLGLGRNDIVAETMRSPKQVELRAKARGLKIPQEFIVSTRSGTSLMRVENAHAPTPAPGRGELVQSFARALAAIKRRYQ